MTHFAKVWITTILALLAVVLLGVNYRDLNVPTRATSTNELGSGEEIVPNILDQRSLSEENYATRTLLTVSQVVDGDTIVIITDGKRETVRMIGIDTPETVHPSKPVQCFGQEASARTKSWLTGRLVTLDTDPSQGERDKYGRLLAYVWRDDGLFVNQALISEGFAFEYTYNLPYEYQAEFKAAEAAARAGKKGLWADEACAESFETSGGTSTFVPANPDDKDCPDFATQAEAQTYFEAGGGSSTYNFDRLDSDHDGMACERLP